MKSKKTIILEKILRVMAKQVLQKYSPTVIGITGSVGKTTTKEMISSVLSLKYSVRKTEKNYNTGIGVPLVILGIQNGRLSLLKMVSIFFKWFKLILGVSDYPKILVLELGMDRPGDIKYFCDFIKFKVGVITNIGISHLAFFNNRKEVAQEKGRLIKSLGTDGLAVVNFDSEEAREIAKNIKANVISYGFESGATMQASDLVYIYDQKKDQYGKEVQTLGGISFKLNYQGKIIPIRLPNFIGKPQIYSVLAAIAVGDYFKINILEMAEGLKSVRPFVGRLNLLPGIKNTTLIDDTYNSAPDSVLAGLEAINNINARRKIIILADMLELGEEEIESHRLLGREVALINPDAFITVGHRMQKAVEEFQKKALRPDTVASFDNPMTAGLFVQKIMQEGDLILVKGSQGLRMEKILEEIMANPSEKESLLVRQSEKWKNTPFVKN